VARGSELPFAVTIAVLVAALNDGVRLLIKDRGDLKLNWQAEGFGMHLDSNDAARKTRTSAVTRSVDEYVVFLILQMI